MKSFVLVFQSRGAQRTRFETVHCRDEKFADMLGEAKANRVWAYLGIAPARNEKRAG